MATATQVDVCEQVYSHKIYNDSTCGTGTTVGIVHAISSSRLQHTVVVLFEVDVCKLSDNLTNTFLDQRYAIHCHLMHQGDQKKSMKYIHMFPPCWVPAFRHWKGFCPSFTHIDCFVSSAKSMHCRC